MNQKIPDTWLFSDNMIKRSFAVLGHYLLAVLLIYLTGAIIAIIITGIAATFS